MILHMIVETFYKVSTCTSDRHLWQASGIIFETTSSFIIICAGQCFIDSWFKVQEDVTIRIKVCHSDNSVFTILYTWFTKEQMMFCANGLSYRVSLEAVQNKNVKIKEEKVSFHFSRYYCTCIVKSLTSLITPSTTYLHLFHEFKHLFWRQAGHGAWYGLGGLLRLYRVSVRALQEIAWCF